VHDLRKVAVTVAAAVARQARAEGLCEAFDDAALDGLIAKDVGTGLPLISSERG